MPFFGGSTLDWGLLALAAYIAVSALVRLMLGERNRLAADMERQIEAERARLAAEKRKAKKKKAA